jgi:O-6-methylguanine DNA methyltransferase
MNSNATTTTIETGLAGLRATAPGRLRASVLADVALADQFARIDSPIGPLVIAWNGIGVSTVDAGSDDAAFVTRHRAVTGRAAYPAESLPPRLNAAIQRRIEGDRRIRIPLDLRGHTAFEQDVWHKALEIPRGEVRAYGWIAAEIGRPKAVRAVGSALGHNPVPLIVPCHRVIRSDGHVGQYSLGGPENKRTILRSEGLDPDQLEAMASSGIRYTGSDTTHIVCLPTCRNARRTTERHLVSFRSLREADRAGYRPCLVCRPDSGGVALVA